VSSGKPSGTGFAKPVAPVSPEKPHMKLNKGFLKAQAKFREKKGLVTSVNGNGNTKHKICYTCRQKGHSGKDCPMGKNPKPSHAHNGNKLLRINSNDQCAPRVVASQRRGTKVIWVPKSMITNFLGPNARWVPKHA
jgi:hypothetical protein